jgi:hypothetical protein
VNDAFVQRLSTVVVVVCLLTLTATVALVVSPSLRQRVGVGPGTELPAYAVGDVVDIEPSAYQDSPISVVLFARSTCAACKRSADFHKQVVAAAMTLSIPTVLVTPSDDAEAERAYADGLGISTTRVYTVTAGSIKLRSVPALMLVESTGLIREVWFGASDASTQATILATVTALAGARVP